MCEAGQVGAMYSLAGTEVTGVQDHGFRLRQWLERLF